jgi:Excalibur calcium-binding domain
VSVCARPTFVVAVLVAAVFAFTALAAAPSPTPLPSPISVAIAGDRDCDDFKNQRRAQRFFKRHHPKRDPHRLDADNDGIACESNPCPCKKKPAFRLSDDSVPARRKASPSNEGAVRGVREYWTPSRMREAEARANIREASNRPSRGGSADQRAGPPGYVPGVRPDTARASYRVRIGRVPGRHARNHPVAFTAGEIQQPGAFPYRLNGKVFASDRRGPFDCSATVVVARSKRLVLTAGHCLRLNGIWARQWVFVPGYHDGQAPYGLWPAKNLYIPNKWARLENENFDFGAAVLRGKIQRAVGAEGIAWNQPREQLYRAYGYPFGGPYDGESLWFCDSQYAGLDPHYVGPGPSPTAIGCDFPPGASGGGWIVGDAFINSVSSFSYDDHPGILYGPYFGGTFKKFYKDVQKLKK